MVSFFGFKIGGEKKKKPANDIDTSPTQLRRKHDREPIEDGQVPSREIGKNMPSGGNALSASRPDTSHSYKVTTSRPKLSPYSSHTNNLGAMSMSELSQSNHPGLKQYASNPNLGTNRFNASTSDLVPPVPVRNPSRPATPVKQQTIWMNPLEMHSTKVCSPALMSAPKSPMGQSALRVDTTTDSPPRFASDGDDNDDEPKYPVPLRIRKPSPAPHSTESSNRNPSPRKPPSPPQSIKDTESPVLGRPAFPKDDFRPSSRGSHRNVTTNLKEVQNARDMPNFGPTSIPSPVSTPRGSEDKPTDSMMTNLWGEPVIQMVRARRDTLTSIAPRRRSLEMKVEELERMQAEEAAAAAQRPKTSNEPQTRKLMRPPPLNLNPRLRTPDRAGTYPPAAPYMSDRPHTPTGQGTRSKSTRERTGPPPAAVGAHGRPGRPNTRNVRRPAADEYVIQSHHHHHHPQTQPHPQPQYQSQSQTHSRGASQDSSSRPPSPDSPLMPLSGPLASLVFSPIESQLAPPPLKNARSLLQLQQQQQEIEALEEPLAMPRLGHRNVPTPDSSDWPLPSPTASSFDAASISQSYRAESPFLINGASTGAGMGGNYYRSESPIPGCESPLPTPPRVLPQGVVAPRSDSPFGIRSFNFSRPMTPTLDQPPLRRDFNGSSSNLSQTYVNHGYNSSNYGGNSAGPASPFAPKRSETVPSPGYREPSTPSRTTRANTVGSSSSGRGLRSPAIVGDDFGGGFI
ncbi:uncharacterized protein F4822DRAFT_131047 [Hypoxylon trugodes]|uniref:uncharacterized protein n=1 Tax=Hypoxylon trugodes TaxID=326681 RepID=UPI00219ED2DB|nr:uncharacterized protein F4822DRAFT_131047 [Hypoxylon trugodes]KAI1392498.1 hypothetical protein F4822DRAFT_131047 [Hypoxylon trugodes]